MTFFRACALSLTVLALGPLAAKVGATEDVVRKLEENYFPELAKKVKAILRAKERSAEVTVDCVELSYKTPMQGYVRALRQALTAKGIGINVVDEGAPTTLRLTVSRPRGTIDGTNGAPCVRVKLDAVLLDTNDNSVIATIDEKQVPHPYINPTPDGADEVVKDLLASRALSVDLKERKFDNASERQKPFLAKTPETKKEPDRQVEVDNRKVRTITGDFGMEVVADGEVIKPAIDKNSSYGQVHFKHGQKYQVWLSNYTERWVLATVAIDGQSAFCLCTFPDDKRPTGFLIRPAKDGKPGVHKVVGYFRDTTHSLAFQVGRLEEIDSVKDLSDQDRKFFANQSEIARKGGRIGAIVAQFHFSYESHKQLLEAEPSLYRVAPPLQSIPGQKIDTGYTMMPSVPGRLQSTIAVRYLRTPDREP